MMMPLIQSITLIALTLILAEPAMAVEAGCRTDGDSWIQISPKNPRAGDAIRVMALSVEGPLTEMILSTDDQSKTLKSHPDGGPPWTLTADFVLDTTRAVRIIAKRNDENAACTRLGGLESDTVNPHEWTQGMEAFYAGWISQLFNGPPEEELSFRSLEPVLRDPERNFLYNYLGNNEDSRLPATPDCADLPYFLRAYFAWKLQLPMAYRACDRGSSSRPPHCGSVTLDDRFSPAIQSAQSFTQFSRKLFDTVHSGSARTGIRDESTDFYPLELSRNALWPGSVYADPYGHTLIIAKWIPPNAGRPGILLAADAQPDNSVTRKRFWEGNFLYADIQGAGPGFKAFRPVLRDEGRLNLPNNARLSEGTAAGAFSMEQEHLSADDFYAKMERVINPGGLQPKDAYESKLSALIEQIQTRVTAVENGQAYARQHRGTIIPMPSGASIFETTGPWEDYASPSRDMRLLIALNVVSKFPELIRRHPELFKLDGRSPDTAADEIEHYHAARIKELTFRYLLSDGNKFELTLQQLFDRRHALEVGYNPNDCPERRWGAMPASDEYANCNRQAPADQAARMEQYRSWFRNTQRPTR